MAKVDTNKERQRLLWLSIRERENELRDAFTAIVSISRGIQDSECGSCWTEAEDEFNGKRHPNLLKLAQKKELFDNILRLWVQESMEYMEEEWNQKPYVSEILGIHKQN